MKKIIAIMGKSGAGKNFYFDYLRQNYPEFNYIKRVTTRPRRDNEPEDSYFFIDIEEYTKLFFSSELVEVGTFREWFYGTPKGQIIDDTINIGIFDPLGVEQLIEHYGEQNIQIIYIDCSSKYRLIRSLERISSEEDVQEVIRRYKVDEEDFSDLLLDMEDKIIVINNDMPIEDSPSWYHQTRNNIETIAAIAQKWKNSLF